MQAVSTGWRAALEARFGAPEPQLLDWVAYRGEGLIIQTRTRQEVANAFGDHCYVLSTAIRSAE